ncbi:hypothetical protein ABIC12_002980 [Pantoea agglomerans]|jgi:hypothetical protein|uniref:hypothetical protein n=1 Tax=Enterobacter agglomerans TaxID=549 RepID=UPI0013B8613D|nr:hypothetical protein [Pantoea agglomerans]MDQ0431041.1 hypothetical protein [Pantoea agglomerans]NEG84752.1 hypothetical protein [Pantoea agglomerans]NEH06893.1 hypothetical protein [Pantoea agglomerans]
MVDIFLLAFFLILPKFGILDLSLLILFLHFSVAFFTSHEKNKVVINNKIVILFTLTVLLYSLSVFSFFINGGDYYDEQFLFKPLRIIILLFLLSYIVNKRGIPLCSILKAILVASFINSIVIYLQYIDHFLGGSGNILINPNFNESVMTPYRKSGLMSGFPVAGILSFCGSMIAFHFFYKGNGKLYLLLYFIIGLTCFLTSRTAMFLFILGTIAYFLTLCFKNGRVDILLAFICIVTPLFSYVLNSENDVISKTRAKMFANVINYYESGDANDYSTNDLFSNHYVMPTSSAVLLIGNSVPPESNVVNTDVSFFRITWNNGLLSTFIYVTSFLFMWLVVIKSSCAEFKEKLVAFVLFLGVFISNFKGFYFFSRVIGDLIFLIFIACTLSQEKRSNG